MALGRQVHHGVRLVGGKDPIQFGAVADIDLLKRIAVAGRYRHQRFQVARIGQLVEIDHRILSVTKDVANHGRTDKTGTAGHKDLH
ncbi:hypothetical protein D3C84_1117180 [compost metagenome]